MLLRSGMVRAGGYVFVLGIVAFVSRTLCLPASKSVPEIAVDDILIGVKTTARNHNSRLLVVLKTWFTQSPSRVFFFSDFEDSQLREQLGKQLIVTKCGSSHQRADLCCKTGNLLKKLMAILASEEAPRTKWLCIVDDDTYVNLSVLRQFLSSLSSLDDDPIYVGKPSVAKKLRLPPMYSRNFPNTSTQTYWFATGGAGLCMNIAAAKKLKDYLSTMADGNDHPGGTMMSLCRKLGVPDDMALGVVFEVLLGVPLLVSNKFHSHLEYLGGIQQPLEQATLSYQGTNTVNPRYLQTIFPANIDPTRFLTMHCALNPLLLWCPA